MDSILRKSGIIYGIVENDKSFSSTMANLLKMKSNTGKVLEFLSAEEAIRASSLSSIDFLVTDLRLTGMDGIAFLGQRVVRNLTIPKLIVSGFNPEERIFEALKFGATGYMFKNELYSLNSIIEILFDGGAYITPTIALRVTHYFREIEICKGSHEKLTERETQILKELSRGVSPQKIAEVLGLSILTVRVHIRNIYKKMEVNNQLGLLQKAKERNLL